MARLATTMASCNIEEFGATGDAKTNDAPAIQKAIDSCSNSGGGKVVFPAGKTFCPEHWC